LAIRLFGGYRPHPGQTEFHKKGTRFLALVAGTRGGKTYAASREFLRRIYRDRKIKSGPLHYWAVSPNYPIGKIQVRGILEAISDSAKDLIVQKLLSQHELHLAGGILIEFKSGERPESLVGVGLDGMWIDEAARLKADAWLGQLRMRLSDKNGWCLFSTTPLSRNNWFFKEVVCRSDPSDPSYDPEFSWCSWTTAENTAVPGLAEEVEKARRTLPPRYFWREYEARFETFTDLVFDEWDRKLHVAEPSCVMRDYVVAGVDWGFRNPGAIVVVATDGDGNKWVIDERVEERIPVQSSGTARTWISTAKELAELHRIGRFFADPSRPENISAFRKAGLHAAAAKNDVAAGLETLAILLHPDEETGKPSLFISPECRELIAEMDGYRYDEDSSEIPLKENDHAIDALRYALMGRRHVPAAF